jgi:hypothetical protein
MLDVIALLNAPAPWEAHGATAPLPASFVALLTDWPGTPADFFRTTGTADDAIRAGKLQAPGLVFGDAAEQRHLAPSSLADLQAAVTALAGQTQPQRLILTGTLRWDGTLVIDDVTGVTLDFSALKIEVAQASAPLIRLARSRKVTLRGLRIGQKNASVLDVSASSDVALTDSALAGAAAEAVLLSGGSSRVLIDRSAFLRNTGPALRVQGEVTGLVVARSAFDGPSRQAFIDLSAAMSARGYGAPAADAPARDALTRMHPTDVRIVENRFGALDHAAILARGTRGLWIERNDFAGAASGAVVVTGPAIGLMVADNRILAPAESGEPLLQLRDVALAAVFRNIFEPSGQVALQVDGGFGGLLVAGNVLMIPAGTKAVSASAAIRLEPAGLTAFLSCTVMLNTIRGPFGSGIVIGGELPRLFLFDNHLFGMADWSLESRVAQPMATSMNNWSPVKSLNLPLSEALIDVARMVRQEG